MKNDLHLHTNLSACASRENTWESLLAKCEEAKLDRISVTDHNTCLFHIINMFTDTTPIFSGEIIPGMECCSITNGATIDLLAYNFDVLKAFDWSFQTYGTGWKVKFRFSFNGLTAVRFRRKDFQQNTISLSGGEKND